jgi:uridine kinase
MNNSTKKSKEIAKRIDRMIKSWLPEEKKIVIAIDGYSGSGKTTVLEYLARINNNVLPLFLDDFIEHWSKRKKMMDQAKNKSKVFELKWYRYRDVEELISRFRKQKSGLHKAIVYDYEKNDFGPIKKFDLSKRVLVIEGIFLFHPEHKISKMWDKKIYLDINFEKGDLRRTQREMEKWGEQYTPETHPDSYVLIFKQAYKKYLEKYKVKSRADVVINRCGD